MMISLGITNPLAAFVNRQAESINQRDARFLAAVLLQVITTGHRPVRHQLSHQVWRGSAIGHQPIPGLDIPSERLKKKMRFLINLFLGSRQDNALFASKVKCSP